MKKILKLKKKKLIEIFKFRDLLNNIKLDFQMYKINKLIQIYNYGKEIEIFALQIKLS